MKIFRLTAVLAAVVPFVAPLVAPAATQTTIPIRTLVYSFSWTGSQNVSAYNRAAEGQNADINTVGRQSQQFVAPGDQIPQSAQEAGDKDQFGSNQFRLAQNANPQVNRHESATRTGKITVEFTGVQPDKGIVLSISEQSNDGSVASANCVVYGNTSFICDPTKHLAPEEYTVLRFLGANFVDPNQLDAQQHWRIIQNVAGLDQTADYTIKHNDDGALTIDEALVLKPKGAPSTDIASTIDYDFTHSVPKAIDEHLTQSQPAGASGSSNDQTHTTLELISDSTTTH
jgi:hypothetical protein